MTGNAFDRATPVAVMPGLDLGIDAAARAPARKEKRDVMARVSETGARADR